MDILTSGFKKTGWNTIRRCGQKLFGSATGRTVVSGLFWTTFGSVVSKGLAFLSIVCLTRILSPELLGQFGFVRSSVVFLVDIVACCFAVAVTRRITELLVIDKNRIGACIGKHYFVIGSIGLALAAAMFIAVPWVCRFFEKAAHLSVPFQVASLALLFLIVDSVQKGVLAGFRDFRGLCFAAAASAIVSIPILLTGAYYWGVLGAILGLGVSSLIGFLINNYSTSRNLKKHHLRYSLSHSETIQWKTNVTFLLLGVINAFTFLWPSILLSMQENGFSRLGIYLAMKQYYTIICFFPAQLFLMVIPTASAAWVERRDKKFVRLLISFVFFVTLAGLTLAVPAALFSTFLAGLFGTGYEEGSVILPYLAFAAVCTALGTLLSRFIISMNETAALLPAAFIWGTTFICLSAFLFRTEWGLAGVPLALLLSSVLHCCMLGIFIAVKIKSMKQQT